MCHFQKSRSRRVEEDDDGLFKRYISFVGVCESLKGLFLECVTVNVVHVSALSRMVQC